MFARCLITLLQSRASTAMEWFGFQEGHNRPKTFQNQLTTEQFRIAQAIKIRQRTREKMRQKMT